MGIADWIDRRLAGRQRLTLTVVGVVLMLAILAGAVAGAWWLRQIAIGDQLTRLDDLAQVLAQHAGRTIEGVDVALTGLSERVAAATDEERRDAAYLRRLIGDHIAGLSHVHGMIFVDESGIGRGDSASAPPRPLDASDRIYFQHHRSTPGPGLFIGPPVLSRVSGLWMLTLSRSVVGVDGAFLGIVVAGLNPIVFSDFYRGLALGGDGQVSLVRADRTLMARHPPDERAFAVPAHAANEPGNESLTSIRRVDRYPLSVVVTLPLRTALAGWEQQVTVIGVAAAIALSLVTLIGLVLLDQSQRLETTMVALAAARDDAIQARLREEEAGRAKSAFLANTSHELRTPLNAILGFSEVMRDGLLGAVDPKQRGYASGIHDAGMHLLGLINDLLDMAKIEARQLQLRETAVDLDDVIADGVKLTERRAVQYGVSVVPRVQTGGLKVRGDAQRLRQIVLNLLSNAIKFTEAGGRVWVEASLDAEGRPALTVSDNGIGMTKEDVEIALTPFRQVESTYAREREGTGLGLPIVKALVEMHGGTLTIRSERHVGTTVTVTLPASRAIAVSTGEAAPPAP